MTVKGKKTGQNVTETVRKTPSGMLQGAFWYWVGESNSYCEIENLEY